MKRRNILAGGIAALGGILATIQSRKASAQNRTITVSTVEQFYEAISSNCTLQLEPGDYILSNLKPNHQRKDVYFDDMSPEENEVRPYNDFIISRIDNLKIVGLGSPPPRILTASTHAHVLQFRNCRNITLENIEAGHAPEQGTCRGGVLVFAGSEDITVEGCILFGSGIRGISAYLVNNLLVKETTIHDCNQGIIHIATSDGILFRNCLFQNNKGYIYRPYTKAENSGAIHIEPDSRFIEFRNCQFRNNETTHLFTTRTDSTLIGFDIFTPSKVWIEDCFIVENSLQYQIAHNPNQFKFINVTTVDNSEGGVLPQ